MTSTINILDLNDVGTRPAIFNEVVMLEQFSKPRLIHLIKSGLIPDVWPDGDDVWLTSMRRRFPKGVLQMMKEYLTKYDEDVNGVFVRYQLSSNNKKCWGRVYPGNGFGLTNMSRDVRNFLIQDVYYDFDIENCFPSIMEQLLKKHGKQCPGISAYNNNRDGWLNNLVQFYNSKGYNISRDTVKNLFCRLCSGGSFETWLQDNNIKFSQTKIKDVDIKQWLSDINEFFEWAKSYAPKLWDYIGALKTIKKEKKKKSFLAHFLQDVERRIVGSVMNVVKKTTNLFFNNCAYFMGTYEFDGMKIRQSAVHEYGSVQDVVNLLNRITLEVSGIPLKWANKEMKTSIILPDLNDDMNEEDMVTVTPKKYEQGIPEITKEATIDSRLNFLDELPSEDDSLFEDFLNLPLRQTPEKRPEKRAFAYVEQVEDYDALIEDDNITYISNTYSVSKKPRTVPVDSADSVISDLVEDCITNDKTAAVKFLKIHPHIVHCKGITYVYDCETGVWSGSPESLRKVILSNSDRLYVYKKTKNGLEKTDDSYGSNSTLMARLMVCIPPMCMNDNWLNQTAISSLGKLLFSNGILDLRLGVFYENFDPTVVFFERFNFPFEKLSADDENYMFDIRQRLFFNPLGEVMGSFLLTYFARALAGDCQKRIMFGIGASNGGKSIISRAVLNACGGYASTFSGENLKYTRTNADEAAQNRWLLLIQNKRVLLSNEINMDMCMNGNGIKKISSGSDDIVGRTHGKEETTFKLHGMFTMFVNDIPPIKPVDKGLANRLSVVNFSKEYVAEPEEGNPLQLKSDPHLPEELSTARFKKAMLALLLFTYQDAYKNKKLDYVPPEAQVDLAKWFPQVEQIKSNDNEIPDSFFTEFEITGDSNHFVVSNNIVEWLKRSDIKMSVTKLGNEIKNYAAKHNLKVESKLKKVKKVAKQCWFGIREVDDIYEDDLVAPVEEGV